MNAYLHRPAAPLHRATTASACRCRSTTASAACWGRWSARSTARRWSSPRRASTPGRRSTAIESERCTSIYGVPTMFVAELDHPDSPRFDLSSLRTGIMAGSPCPLPLMKAVVETLGASRDHDRLRPDRGVADHHADLGRTTRSRSASGPSAGRSRASRSGSSTRRPREVVAEGEAGELCVRGHGVMAGYYKDPEATARVIDARRLARHRRPRPPPRGRQLPDRRPVARS